MVMVLEVRDSSILTIFVLKIAEVLILIYREIQMSAITIAIEGSDGSGKATQTELLAGYLQRYGFKVGRVSFPRYTGTPAGRMLFEYLKSSRASEYDFVNANPKLASRIYAQDRFESLEYLQGLIERNDAVIFDRYVESNLLHQGGKFATDSERMSFAKWLSDLEYGELGLPQPQLTVYLDLPYSIAYDRSLKRAKEKGESLDAVESDMKYVKNGCEAGRLYASMFKWKVIECVEPNRENHLIPAYEFTPEEIHQKIQDVVNIKRKG